MRERVQVIAEQKEPTRTQKEHQAWY